MKYWGGVNDCQNKHNNSAQRSTTKTHDIPGMPTTLIFDREGKLQHQHAAFKLNKIAEYEQLIDKALAASK